MIKFLEAMKALDEGKEVEWSIGGIGWTTFNIDIVDCQKYSLLSKAEYRIKEQKKRMAKALCKDSNGNYFETPYYFETKECAEKNYGSDIVRFPHGEWIEI